jgi:hypothetical protein
LDLLTLLAHQGSVEPKFILAESFTPVSINPESEKKILFHESVNNNSQIWSIELPIDIANPGALPVNFPHKANG